MIRFRTIEPAEATSPALQPAAPAPQPAAPQAEAAVGEITPAKPKGLVRKSPLRAKKPQETSLFGK